MPLTTLRRANFEVNKYKENHESKKATANSTGEEIVQKRKSNYWKPHGLAVNSISRTMIIQALNIKLT